MDPSQYNQLLAGLQNVAAQEPTQPVIEEDEDDFKALTQEDLEGMGQFLIAHSGSQVLGGINKFTGITKKAGLSPEDEAEFAEAIKDGELGKVFQKITKYGLKRVSTTLEKKGGELIRTGQEKLLPKTAPDFVNPFKSLSFDDIDSRVIQRLINPPEDEAIADPADPVGAPVEDPAAGQKVIQEAGERTKALNAAQDDLDAQIREASSTLENFIPRVDREAGLVSDDLAAGEGSKAYLEPLLKGFSKDDFNTFKSKFKDARLKTDQIPDDALRRRLNSRIGENIVKDMKENLEQARIRKDGGAEPDATGEGNEAPDIYNARQSIKTDEIEKAQQEARARTGEANLNLDKQDAQLQDLISQAEKNQGSIQDALNQLNKVGTSSEEATGAGVGEVGEGFIGRITSLGDGGGRISNAFNLSQQTFKPDTTLLDSVKSNMPLDGGRGSLIRNPLNDVAQTANDRLNQVRDLAQSGRQALTEQLTQGAPKVPEVPVSGEQASDLLKGLAGDVEETTAKIGSSISSKAEEAVGALKDLTKISAEDDIDPANILLTGALGIGSLIGGLFIKPSQDKDISVDTNPTNISVQVGA